MTRDEGHRALLAAHRAGDATALARLCLELGPFVGWLARRYYVRGEEIEDLESVARVGLLEGLERFDPAERSSVASYAGMWARARLAALVTRGMGSSRTRHAFWNASSAAARVEARGEVATDEAVAAELGVTVEHVALARRPATAELTGEEVDADARSALDEAMDEQARRRALDAVAALGGRERAVVERCVMGDERAASVAREMGVSDERVRQIKDRALARLRRVLL